MRTHLLQGFGQWLRYPVRIVSRWLAMASARAALTTTEVKWAANSRPGVVDAAYRRLKSFLNPGLKMSTLHLVLLCVVLTRRNRFVIVTLVVELCNIMFNFDSTLQLLSKDVRFVHEQNLRRNEYPEQRGVTMCSKGSTRTIWTFASSLFEQMVFHSAKVSSMQLTLGASGSISLKDESGARKMRAVISLK